MFRADWFVCNALHNKYITRYVWQSSYFSRKWYTAFTHYFKYEGDVENQFSHMITASHKSIVRKEKIDHILKLIKKTNPWKIIHSHIKDMSMFNNIGYHLSLLGALSVISSISCRVSVSCHWQKVCLWNGGNFVSTSIYLGCSSLEAEKIPYEYVIYVRYSKSSLSIILTSNFRQVHRSQKIKVIN